MEDAEVPLESVQENMHESLHSHSGPEWLARAALTAAILAVFAAISAMLSGHHANEAMIEQIHASDKWAHYQAKSIKSQILNSKKDLLLAFDRPLAEKDNEKLAEYATELEKISDEASRDEASAGRHFQIHEILARSVTFFQIAIAVGAIAVLSKRKRFWHLSILFGLCGLAFLIQGLLVHA